MNHRPTDAELKTILLDALSASKLRAYQTLYQQYCNQSHNGKTNLDLYNNIHDLVKYESDGINKSSTRDSEFEDSDALRSTRGSSRSSNSHSSRRNAQIAAAANQNSMQVAANTSAYSNILYQQSPGNHHGTSPSNHGRGPQQAQCKNCKSTKHGTKWCTSTKCFEPNCGKTFATAEERKTHFINEHWTLGGKSSPQKPLKSALKDWSRKPKVKFTKAQRMVSLANRVQRNLDAANQSADDSEVSCDSSISVDHAPKSLVWKGKPNRSNHGRKVSKLRSVSLIRRMEQAPDQPGQDGKSSADSEDEGLPPPCVDSSDDEWDDAPPPLCVDSSDDGRVQRSTTQTRVHHPSASIARTTRVRAHHLCAKTRTARMTK
jgi:hypothetical protein